jgi:hypothetical protein
MKYKKEMVIAFVVIGNGFVNASGVCVELIVKESQYHLY